MENNCQHPTQETRMTGWVWLHANITHVRSPNYQQHQSSTSRHNTKQTIRFISPSVPSAYLCFSLGTTRSPFLSAPTMQCFPKRFGFKHTQPNINSYTYTNTHQKKIHCVIYNFILRMKLTDTECISYNFSRWLSVVIPRDVWWNCGVSRVNR